MSETFATIRARFAQAGQEHIFHFWDSLSAEEQENLLAQARQIDLDELQELVRNLLSEEGGNSVDPATLQPAPYIPHPTHGGDRTLWQDAHARGEEALRAGRVAAFTVAGGQGTRLGYDGPKGSFPITPVRHHPLFGVFAEKILAARRRYNAAIPWFIMTGHQNHEATQAFFSENDFFGLQPDSVVFLQQGRMPAVDENGRVLLETRSSLALSPDGHGGSLRAMVRSGALDQMDAAGIDIISYFQVDNPLVHCIDPAFLGFHLDSGGEFSSKMIPKAYPEEKLGHFCQDSTGKRLVVEYSDMPTDLAKATDAEGNLKFRAGSIAIHILGTRFARRLGEGSGEAVMPFHRAHKKVPSLDAEGQPSTPEQPNAYKFELFVFDALPFARDPVIVETVRAEEFSPVKNATGVDSPESCRNDQLRQWTRWARQTGIEIPADPSGLPSFPWEVSPLFADTASAFQERWNSLQPQPTLAEGLVLHS